jgi:lipid-A-disaccharide synthase
LNIAIFAGEASGDVQGAALAAALRARSTAAVGNGQCPLSLWGIGGARMREGGIELRHDSTHWGVMGTYEALKLAPRLLWVLSRIKRDLLERRPDVLVLIDFGAFNARAAAWAKRQGLKVLYYFPPGSWRRGPIRPGPRSLPTITDRIATPFSWSEAALKAAGADARFVGHPLLDVARPTMTRDEFREMHGIPREAPLICHLPGSRWHELAYIWPAMQGAAALLSERVPGVEHVVALAPSVGGQRFVQREQSSGRPASPTDRHHPLINALRPPATVYDALAASDVAITKSGTVTLEAAIIGLPMVIIYRVSPIQEAEYNLLHRGQFRFIGMPNIILERIAFPELIQHQATPQGIAAAAMPLLSDPTARAASLKALGEVRAALGEPGGVARTADLVLDLAARE